MVVVDRTHFQAFHVLDGEDSLGRGTVRERGRGDDVADRVDVRLAGAHERIDLHHAALDFDLRPFQSAILGDGAAAGGGENNLDVERLLLALRTDHDFDAAVADFRRLHFRVGQDFDAFLLENAREFFRDLFVLDRQEHRHDFDDRDLRAEAGEDRSEFAADRARADDEHRLRYVADFQDVVGVDDALAVRLDVRQVARTGTHRQDDVLRAQRFAVDLNHSLSGQSAEAGDALDLVLFEKELDAFRVRVDDSLLARLNDVPVEMHVADGDAELFRLLNLGPDVGVFEQRFGGDAAAVETRAADEWILLDDGDLHAELPGANPGHIAARTAADHHHVVLLFSQGKPPVSNAARIIWAGVGSGEWGVGCGAWEMNANNRLTRNRRRMVTRTVAGGRARSARPPDTRRARFSDRGSGRGGNFRRLVFDPRPRRGRSVYRTK